MLFPDFQLNGLGTSFISVADKPDCSHGFKPTNLKGGQSSPKAGAEARWVTAAKE